MAIHNNGVWPYRVQIGDVLLDASGNLRTVIDVSYDAATGFNTHVALPILRTSWTRRPYTVLNYVDLAIRGFLPTGKRVKITGLLAKAREDALHKPTKDRRTIFARDTVGVIR